MIMDRLAQKEKKLTPVKPLPGQPLYRLAKERILDAIEAGVFQQGERIPSTEELARQLDVSLVTTHRALRDLVMTGVLKRTQGRGTFVDRQLPNGGNGVVGNRVGLVFHGETSLADYYHSQILEGMRRAAREAGLDMVLLRFGEDFRDECKGLLFVNPREQDMAKAQGLQSAQAAKPVIVVGAKHERPGITYVDTDNTDLARQAVEHLVKLGHRRIGFVGGDDAIANSRDRAGGFMAALDLHGLAMPGSYAVRSAGWRLSDEEASRLVELLAGPDRPTAIFAGGYYFALNVYDAAERAGLRVPTDLSVVAVDDPPSAAFLSPPLTTLQQPLVRLGAEAVQSLSRFMTDPADRPESVTLQAELIERGSTGVNPARAK